MQVEVVLAAGAGIGESPVWCDRAQVLWWVDIAAGALHRFAPATGEDRVWPMGRAVACIALTEGPDLVLALADGLFRFTPETGALAPLTSFEADRPENRPNDGAMGRDGRFYFGTMKSAPDGVPGGALYRLDPDGRVTRLLEGLHVSNGLAVSPDGGTLYLSDSWKDVRKVWAFDLKQGEVSNRRVFFDTAGRLGRPDGGCVDAEGFYWSAAIDGGQLLRISPAGEVVRVIEMPVKKPTKCCFGGPDLDVLYVTSLGETDDSPDAGALMALRPGVKGLPEPRLAI
ncbi:MAG TPA: SMP-30/gluconolactonase/LRE family protein [Paracoccus sp. (in: a-proteobacteria)]|uniref:SMP-30/gluconolactonase/LRE family protein n=1 Tax=uncultured Paracoccus sp. TaxID=189685 RepID=UPI0026198856|nr:SMP-30/gluconolactonase/LRE family protein [uncultured Paracoccus sp.]HMQ39692.1 SMP-30/gluconolactonase/LRE family protein [Paracoccus sp. (in: a-proteobacteria)]HMR34828.1 SMP-30/gluconolactonase/LRE family protein [Paracoccus sp. (in: a-proteobacteria)]